MNLTIQELSTIFPSQTWIPLQEEDYPDLSTNELAYSNRAARSVAQLNQTCLNAFIRWSQANLDFPETVSVWPNQAALPSIWEMTTGTAIALGNRRLVLIPSDAIDTEELCVPQEWVDIPQWSADYYLGIQMDFEQGWMKIWGYTSHRTLKSRGEHDPIYRTYSLERDIVITDLDILWVANSLGLDEKAALQSIADLSKAEADRLLTQLSAVKPYSPRLDLAFETWAAFLVNNDLRQQLYLTRMQQSEVSQKEVIAPSLNNPVQKLRSTFVNTALWFQDQVDQLAEDLSWVLLPAFSSELGGLAQVGLRSQTQEITAMLAQLQRNGIEIPQNARGAYQDLQVATHQMRLYAVTWKTFPAGAMPEWSLLLILSGQPSHSLLPGTRIQIRDAANILVDEELKDSSGHQYIYGGVSGTSDETFGVDLTFADGSTLTLPEFEYDPKSL
jgi:hypothetical protein